MNKLAQTGNEIKETIRETLYSFYALDLYGGTGVGQEGEERMAESLSPLKKKKPAQEAVIWFASCLAKSLRVSYR